MTAKMMKTTTEAGKVSNKCFILDSIVRNDGNLLVIEGPPLFASLTIISLSREARAERAFQPCPRVLAKTR